jgi:hypothetical protein
MRSFEFSCAHAWALSIAPHDACNCSSSWFICLCIACGRVSDVVRMNHKMATASTSILL